jgi:hypothetical protein
MDASTTELISTRSPLEPQYFYCCKYDTNQLVWTNLLTREQFSHSIPGYLFKLYCRWSELPGGSLLITGGGKAAREVVQIDTLREFAVCAQAPMHTPRIMHAVLYHSQYLYVMGGFNGRNLSECERYVCEDRKWEALPALPLACIGVSVVELDNSLYAIGGWDTSCFDTVQKLSLDSLTWELMDLKLPQCAHCFLCFKTESQVYMVIKKTLYSFTPLEIKPIKTIADEVWCESSYYSRGTLYYTSDSSIESLDIGELSE